MISPPAPPLWATDPEPEDPLEAIRAASAANMASAAGGRVDAWLEEIRTRREDDGNLDSSAPRADAIPTPRAERMQQKTEPKQPRSHYQNKGAETMTSNPNRPLTVSDLFPSPWLRASDLKTPVTVKIISAELVEVYDKRRQEHAKKLALGFEYRDKPLSKRLLVNKTNAYALAEICGTEEVRHWPGHVVTLSPGMSPNRKPTIIVSKQEEGAV